MPLPLRSAVVLGATGLVGGHLLRALSVDPSCEGVVAIGRTPSRVSSPTVKDVTADLAKPETYRDYLGVDCVFCALGTTIKKAGSEAAFRRVDYEYPLTVAREALAMGARRYVIVTAVGADEKSRVFYNRVKGELESALRGITFSHGLRVMHPSLLVGDRTESRPGERVAAALMGVTKPLFAGVLAKYRPIEAKDVAHAMIVAARADGDGVVVYEGKSLFEAADQRGLQPQA